VNAFVVVDLGAGAPEDDKGSTDAWAFARAVERHRPGLVARYLVAPEARLPDDLVDLLRGKVATAGDRDSIPAGTRVFHSLSVMDLTRSMNEVWPPDVERLGLAYSVSVGSLEALRPGAQRAAERRSRRYEARLGALRQADALLTVSEQTAAQLVDLLGADPALVTVVGSDEAPGESLQKMAAVFERLAAIGRRAWRATPRIAFVSPFPPIASGVASYSSRLAEALSAELGHLATGGRLDCFADGRDRAPADPVLPRISGECFDARRFAEVELALGGYDGVVYVLGNSEFHSGALAALRHRGGTVMAHDVRMTGLLRHSAGRRGAVPGGLEGAVRRAHGGELPAGLEPGQPVTEQDLARVGLLLVGEVLRQADQLLVTSRAARQLALAEAGEGLGDRVGVLPFAMELTESELETVSRARAETHGQPPTIASFGIVDPSKLPALLVTALAAVRADHEVELAFVGPVSDALAEELAELAAGLGVGNHVSIAGHVDRDSYLRALGRTTVAVQLRAGFAGEASAAVGDCMAAGTPIIVSDLGWMSELPDDAVVKLDRGEKNDDAEALAGAMVSLLDDADRRASLSKRASEFAAEQTFARAAAALVAALGFLEGG
jgi:glycosyltransferase involved in cell wall biosynthesis